MGSAPVFRRSPEEGNGNPLHYSCLGHLIDRGGPQSMGSQRIGYDWAHMHTNWYCEEKGRHPAIPGSAYFLLYSPGEY